MSDPVLWRSLVFIKVEGYADLTALVMSLPVLTMALVKDDFCSRSPLSHTTVMTLLRKCKNLSKASANLEPLINSGRKFPAILSLIIILL
jgi:hypothetical protein